MSIRNVTFFVVIAAALACATLIVASLSFQALLSWLQSLPPREAKLFQPVLVICLSLLVALSVFLKRRRKEPEA